MKLLNKLMFWRKPVFITGMTIPVIIPGGGAKVSVSITSDKNLDIMVVRANDEVIGFRQTTKTPTKLKEGKDE